MDENDGKGRSQVGSTVMEAAAAVAAEGCLLNMPRKIGFEILIFPRHVSTPFPRSPSRVLPFIHRFPSRKTLFAGEKYTILSRG